ncbi:Uncharacterised protein [Halioglobus japonicus]|nr:Uncharacterised protein [Halioglobus japonicus]
MSAAEQLKLRVSADFQQASGSPRRKAKRAPPFSLRLTAEERAYLEDLAGNQSLSAYIRKRLLGDQAEKRRELRKPTLEDQQYATMLALLGETRYASNLNQIAKHANMGTLDPSEDVEQLLQEACEAVLAMRDTLITMVNLVAGR